MPTMRAPPKLPPPPRQSRRQRPTPVRGLTTPCHWHWHAFVAGSEDGQVVSWFLKVADGPVPFIIKFKLLQFPFGGRPAPPVRHLPRYRRRHPAGAQPANTVTARQQCSTVLNRGGRHSRSACRVSTLGLLLNARHHPWCLRGHLRVLGSILLPRL